MLRKLAPALAAGLLLTAAVPSSAPAQPIMNAFSQKGIILYRIENVLLDRATGRYSLRIAVTNKSGRRMAIGFLITVMAHQPGRLDNGGSVRPRREGFPPGDIVLAPDEGAILTYDLPDDPARPMLTVITMEETGRTLEIYSSSIEDLRALGDPGLMTTDLESYAGRYRTNLGTLLTLSRDGNRLIGSSGKVGPRPDYGQSYVLTPTSEYSLKAVLKQPRGEDFGEVALSAGNNRPLWGTFTKGALLRQKFVACAVDESEPVNWNDPNLRLGAGFWARLDSADAARQANGLIRVNAQVRVWSVLTDEGNFNVAVAEGYQVNAWMGRSDPGVSDYDLRVKRCQAKTLHLTIEGDFDKVTSLFFERGLDGRAYSEPWDISALIARARAQTPPAGTPAPAQTPSPVSDPAPAPAPTPPTSSGTGGASRPTREGSGDGVPAALKTWSNYGIWDFRVEELKPGPDGDWQAVVRVRDAASYRVGLATGGVLLWLFDEDGRSVASNEVNYRASVTGAANQLEAIPQTMWMEKGDEIRVRLLIRHSKGFKPVRLRLGSGDRETLSRTWDLP